MGRPKLRSARTLDPSIRRTLDALVRQNKTTEIVLTGSLAPFTPSGQVSNLSQRSTSASKNSAATPLSTNHRKSSSYSKYDESKPQHQPPRTSRSRSQSPSRSRAPWRKDPGHRHQKPLAMTPSRYWNALPMIFRIILFMAGFVFIYYIIFAKHHYFDREASAIQNDVEDLIRRVNKTGFMKKLFIDAKLPDIFKEDVEPPVPPTDNDSKDKGKSTEKDKVKVKIKGNVKDKDKNNNQRASNSGSKKSDLEKHNKTGEEVGMHKKDKTDGLKVDEMQQHINGKSDKDKNKKQKKYKDTKKDNNEEIDGSYEKKEIMNESDDKKDENVNNHAEPVKVNIEEFADNPMPLTIELSSATEKNEKEHMGKQPGEGATSGSNMTMGSGLSDTNENNNSIENPLSVEGAVSEKDKTERTADVSSEKSITDAPAVTEATNNETLAREPPATDAATTNSSTETTPTSEQTAATNTIGVAKTSPQNTVASTGESGTLDKEGTELPESSDISGGKTIMGGISENSFTFEETNYSRSFRDLEPNLLPKNQIPLLSWNYESISDPGVSEQIFGLGQKLDHVAVYKPLCIDVEKETALVFEGKYICSGFNRTVGWFVRYCSVMKDTIRKEYLLQVEKEHKPQSWLAENEGDIHWIEELTILQILEKNCGNIAHFAGRILLLQHIMENIASYSAPPRNPANILIVPTFHVMKRFLYPHNYGFWHKTMFQALIAPHKYTIGTLGNFLYRDSKPRPNNAPIVQLLKNFSVTGSAAASKKYVCFRRAIVPSYLKARFFVNDFEIPSMKPSLQSKLDGAPPVPRDSLRLRERVSALIDQKVELEGREKEIVLLDRNGPRRVFEPEGHEKALTMMKNVAEEKGYTFTVIGFHNLTFDKQYHNMKKVAIAIGIHGANLVNTIFMPPLSVLFEIFPFGFSHEMYVNGGNSGLKYMSYSMKEGKPFDGLKIFRSVDQCIKLNPKCKVHYRDATLQTNEADVAEMESILRKAIKWCDSITNVAENRINAQNEANKSVVDTGGTAA